VVMDSERESYDIEWILMLNVTHRHCALALSLHFDAECHDSWTVRALILDRYEVMSQHFLVGLDEDCCGHLSHFAVDSVTFESEVAATKENDARQVREMLKQYTDGLQKLRDRECGEMSCEEREKIAALKGEKVRMAEQLKVLRVQFHQMQQQSECRSEISSSAALSMDTYPPRLQRHVSSPVRRPQQSPVVLSSKQPTMVNYLSNLSSPARQERSPVAGRAIPSMVQTLSNLSSHTRRNRSPVLNLSEGRPTMMNFLSLPVRGHERSSVAGREVPTIMNANSQPFPTANIDAELEACASEFGREEWDSENGNGNENDMQPHNVPDLGWSRSYPFRSTSAHSKLGCGNGVK